MVQYRWNQPGDFRVFDGNGKELFDCVNVNTDTGEVERLKTSPDGIYIVAPDGKRVQRETIIVPGVRVEPEIRGSLRYEED